MAEDSQTSDKYYHIIENTVLNPSFLFHLIYFKN